MTAVTMSVTLALVLDGIAMSTKTPTSLKKALSYRAVEILLIEKRRSDDPDFRGCRKVDQVDQESFVTFGPDRRELAEEVPEGVPKMKSARVAEAVLQMKSPFVQRCSGEEGVDEVVPKMKSPFVEKRSSREGGGGRRVAEIVSNMKSPFVEKDGPNENKGVVEVVPKMKSPFVEKCGAGGGVEVVPKMKSPFVEKGISNEKEGIFEIVPKMKSPFVENRS